MKSTTNFTMTIDLPDGKLDTIPMYLKTLIPGIVTEPFRQVVLEFAETVRLQEPCPHCQAVGKAHWKRIASSKFKLL